MIHEYKNKEINIVLQSLALGGTEKFAVDFANYLVINGWKVNIITTRAEDGLSRIGQLNERVSISSINASNAFEGFIGILKIRSRLMRSAAINLGLQNVGNVALLLFPKRKFGKKVSTIRRQPPSRLKILLRILLRVVYNKSDLILTNVITAETDYRKYIDKIKYFPNAVEIAEETKIPQKLKPFTVLTIANLRPEKNLDLLLDIASNLKSEDIRFMILGSGPEFSRLKNRANKESLKVEFIGRVFETSNYLNKADLYLHTSKSEGFPNSILEAMAHSLPVVASNIPSSVEALGNIDTIFSLVDSQQAANIILKLKSDEQYYKLAASLNVKRVASKFSRETVFRSIMNEIEILAK
jgi:GalNAc-alpha-(1->4)-GalNAc-alpha-(1->3)-diNAcBac-PP-undecaprenol alpha-1,4-N-acetyl-D-galactosaminyltransferase